MPENAPETEPEVEETGEPTEPDGSEDLGDKGKKALDAMKSERNAARKESRDLKARLAELEQKPNGTGDDDAIEAARREAAAEATTAANQRILRTEVRVAAAGKLADPADALAYIDLSDFEVDDNGDIDTAQIAEAIADLLDKKPYLAAKRFQGDGDMGKGKQKQAPKPPSQNDLLRAAFHK